MVTLLTATGGRPEAFAKCIEWMYNQDYTGLVHWIIVNDYDDVIPDFKIKEGWKVSIIRPTPKWSPGDNTQSRNLLEGLKLVEPDDYLFIIEDDDYYSPSYISTYVNHLDEYDLVGEKFARYYNVAHTCYKECPNSEHASLCSTAMKGGAIELFKEVCEENHTFIDMILWDRQEEAKKNLFRTGLVVGIKGLPGRPGIGSGHKMKFNRNSIRKDFDYNKLKKWVGKDYVHYVEGEPEARSSGTR